MSNFPDAHPSGVPYGRMVEGNCKEQFSIAYIHAIVTAARCKLQDVKPDDESVDATIRQSAHHTKLDHVSLDVQLKCTSQDIETQAGFTWKLSYKNYTELSTTRRSAPAILVVLRVPGNLEEWALHEPEKLTLVRSAYWMSLRGAHPLTEGATKTVTLPRENHFNVEQLLGILDRVGNGGQP